MPYPSGILPDKYSGTPINPASNLQAILPVAYANSMAENREPPLFSFNIIHTDTYGKNEYSPTMWSLIKKR
jgi:hypothetical protein